MTNDYDNVLGTLDLTKQNGLTEVVVDKTENTVEILLFGTIWITLNTVQAVKLKDILITENI